MGVLHKDPEKRFTPNNVAVTVLVLSVPQYNANKGVANDHFFLKVTCWRNLAEQATQLQAGQTVLVEGKLMMNQFNAPDGTPRKQFELEASQLMLAPGIAVPLADVAGTVTAGTDSAPVTQRQPVGVASSAPASTDLSPDDFLTEDDIPF
jgi:single-stranded DNA-binding protein